MHDGPGDLRSPGPFTSWGRAREPKRDPVRGTDGRARRGLGFVVRRIAAARGGLGSLPCPLCVSSWSSLLLVVAAAGAPPRTSGRNRLRSVSGGPSSAEPRSPGNSLGERPASRGECGRSRRPTPRAPPGDASRPAGRRPTRVRVRGRGRAGERSADATGRSSTRCRSRGSHRRSSGWSRAPSRIATAAPPPRARGSASAPSGPATPARTSCSSPPVPTPSP